MLFHHFDCEQFQLLIIVDDPTVEVLLCFFKVLEEVGDLCGYAGLEGLGGEVLLLEK